MLNLKALCILSFLFNIYAALQEDASSEFALSDRIVSEQHKSDAHFPTIPSDNWSHQSSQHSGTSRDDVLSRIKRQSAIYNEADISLKRNFEPPRLVKDLPSSYAFCHNNGRKPKFSCEAEGYGLHETTFWYMKVISKNKTFSEIKDVKTTGFTARKTGNSIEVFSSNHPTMIYCKVSNKAGLVLSRYMTIISYDSEGKYITVEYETFVEKDKIIVRCKPETKLFQISHWQLTESSRKKQNISETNSRYSFLSLGEWSELHIRDTSRQSMEMQCWFRSPCNNDDALHTSLKTHQVNSAQSQQSTNYNNLPNEPVEVLAGSSLELPCYVPSESQNVIWKKRVNSGSAEIVLVKDVDYKPVANDKANIIIDNFTAATEKYICLSDKRKILKEVTIAVKELLKVSLSPKSQAVVYNTTATLNCQASSGGEIFWLHNGKLVSKTDPKWSMYKNLLKIHRFDYYDAGVYQCAIKNRNRNNFYPIVDYEASSLTIAELPPRLVEQDPSATKHDGIVELKVKQDQTIRIRCSFAGLPKPNVTWYRDNERIPINDLEDETYTINIQDHPAILYVTLSEFVINLNRVRDKSKIWEYGGLYKAVANNSEGTAMCQTMIFIEGVGLKIRPMKAVTYGILNRPFDLYCNYVADGKAEVFWYLEYFNTRTQTKDRAKLPYRHQHELNSYYNRFLHFSFLTTEDSTTFDCEVKKNGQVKKETTKLEVREAPEMNGKSLSVMITNNKGTQTRNYICSASNIPKHAWYAWWTFTPISGPTRIIVPDENNGNNIVVKYLAKQNILSPSKESEELLPVLPEFLRGRHYQSASVDLQLNRALHSGNWTCHIRNIVDEVTRAIRIQFMPEVNFAETPPNQAEVTVGDPLMVNCTPASNGEYKILVVWKYRQDKRVLTVQESLSRFENRITQLNNGSLYIEKYESGDPEHFLCFLSVDADLPTVPQKKTETSRAVNLNVHYPAEIELDIQEKEVKVGEKLEVSCIVSGDDKNREVRWFVLDKKGAQTIEDYCVKDHACEIDQTENVVDGKYIKKLIMPNVRYTYPKKFKCQAHNSYNKKGPDTKEFTMTIVDVPSIPQDVQFESKKDRIELTWTPPSNNYGCQVEEYKIDWKLRDAPLNETNSFTSRPDSMNKKEVITGLRPHQYYSVTIQAKNRVGFSEVVPNTILTQSDKPTGPATNLMAQGLEPQKIKVSWDPPEKSLRNGEMTHYWVYYNKFDNIESPNSLTKQAVDHDQLTKTGWAASQTTTTRTNIVLNNLEKFTKYSIIIIAHNTIGASPPAFVSATTLEDIPQDAPKDLQCHTANRQLKISWNPPSKDKINGILKFYKVYYYIENERGDESEQVTLTVNVDDGTSIILYDVVPFSKYNIRVAAGNNKGVGIDSDRIRCISPEQKSGPLELAKLMHYNDSCVLISWLPPRKPNGRIKSYCFQMEPNLGNPLCYNVEGLGGTLERIVCGNNYANYYNSVEAWAVNSAGIGDKKIIDFVYTKISSIGHNISAEVGARIELPCKVVPSQSFFKTTELIWLFRRANEFDYDKLSNRSITFESVKKSDTGFYKCALIGSSLDDIVYFLDVQENHIDLPITPLLKGNISSLDSIQVIWVNRGNRGGSKAAVTAFYLRIFERNNPLPKELKFPPNIRKHYEENIPCGTQLTFTILAENIKGNSSWSRPLKTSTLGKAPIAPDTYNLIPPKNYGSTFVNFQLDAFLPGEGCKAEKFQLIVTHWAGTSCNYQNPITNRTISSSEISPNIPLKVKLLNAGSFYCCKIIGSNAAGSAEANAQFYTLTKDKSIPTHSTSIKPGGPDSLNPLYIFLIAVIVVIIIVFFIILLVFRRHRITKAHKHSGVGNGATPGGNMSNKDSVLKKPLPSIPTEPYLPSMQNRAGEMLNRKSEQRLLPVNRDAHGAAIYSRGAYDPRMGRPPVQEDRISTGSDEEISPYATYQGAMGGVMVDGDADPVDLQTVTKKLMPMNDRMRVTRRSFRGEKQVGGDLGPGAGFGASGGVGGGGGGGMVPQHYSYNYPVQTQNGGDTLKATPHNSGYSRHISYENASTSGTLTPERRVNSMDNLSRIRPQGRVETTYSRGFAAPNGPAPNTADPVFYGDTSKQSDRTSACRASVLSSATMSSTNEELDHAYQVGKERPYLTLPGRHGRVLRGTGVFMLSGNRQLLEEHEVDRGSGESGSSETTDPGILRFTNQPPRADEARHATCEVPMYSKQASLQQSGIPQAGRLANDSSVMRDPTGQNRRPSFHRGISECSDTYEAVDYHDPHSAMMTSYPNPSNGRAGQARVHQPLPAIPPSKKIKATRPGRTISESTYGSNMYDVTGGGNEGYYYPNTEGMRPPEHNYQGGPGSHPAVPSGPLPRFNQHSAVLSAMPAAGLYGGDRVGVMIPGDRVVGPPSIQHAITGPPPAGPIRAGAGPSRPGQQREEENIYEDKFTLV